MNDQFGTTFPEPTRFATKGEYVPSLLGEGKMSKSVEGSAIELGDSLDSISKKLKKVPTDSGQGSELPSQGSVANILQFVELFQGEARRREYEQAYLGSGIRYGELKSELAEAIFVEIQPIQARRRELEANPDYIKKTIRLGAERARTIAEETLREVRQAMGLH